MLQVLDWMLPKKLGGQRGETVLYTEEHLLCTEVHQRSSSWKGRAGSQQDSTV